MSKDGKIEAVHGLLEQRQTLYLLICRRCDTQCFNCHGSLYRKSRDGSSEWWRRLECAMRQNSGEDM